MAHGLLATGGELTRRKVSKTSVSALVKEPVPVQFAPDTDQLAEGSAEAVLQALLPDFESCQVVAARMHREHVCSAADLARLDKEDLAELGLGMVERSRVLAWAREAVGSETDSLATKVRDVLCMSSLDSPRPHNTLLGDISKGPAPVVLSRCTSKTAFATKELSYFRRRAKKSDPHYHCHLEALEQQADFWCGLAGSWTPQMAIRWRRSLEGVRPDEVRESLLESVFDLSQERVREVYDSMTNGMGDCDAVTTSEQLRWGLEKYGLQLPTQALKQLMEAVLEERDDEAGSSIHLAEFECIISRLTLAQIVTFLEAKGGGVGGTAAPKAGNVAMTVFDYSVGRKVTEQVMVDAMIRRFFFGHRPTPEEAAGPRMRWMHLRGFNLNLLLGLTVKYNLHPLAVEDTIEQAPSKADRYGPHYFTTIEGLCLAAPPDETEPVCVRGYHVAVFCAGPPMLDTVITVAQEDKSFNEDWPRNSAHLTSASAEGVRGFKVDAWADKVRTRLYQPLSRVRERRGDFLVYTILDAVTDELMAVVRAYIARLAFMEGRLGVLGPLWPRSQLNEVVLIRRQLHAVSRRMRGIARNVKKFTDDRDIKSGGLIAYLQDIAEHLDEVWDDCDREASKCGHLADAYDRAVDRERDRRARALAEQTRKQELRRAAQADRQNNILFILAVVTTVFCPIQFIAGVYGMNFVDKDGRPTVPELLWDGGYEFFWAVVGGYFLLCICIAVVIYYRLRRPCGSVAGVGEGEGEGVTAFEVDMSPTSASSEVERMSFMECGQSNPKASNPKVDYGLPPAAPPGGFKHAVYGLPPAAPPGGFKHAVFQDSSFNANVLLPARFSSVARE